MIPSSPHKQVPCKVTAYVDEKIKGLVEVINEIDELSTFESCQGNLDKGRLAFVYVEYGGRDMPYDDSGKFIEMACFVYKLAMFFAHHTEEGEIEGAGSSTSISIEWRGDKRMFPIISIETPSCYIEEVTRLLFLFRDEYKKNKTSKQVLH